MRNQFFYTYEYEVASKDELAPLATLTRMASFNIEKVIRSIEIEDGTLVVILDDFHEETRQGVKNNANGKPIVTQERVMLQSEIHLNVTDKERFKAFTELFNSNLIDFSEIKAATNGV